MAIDLRFETEAVLLDLNSLDDFPPEDLVAGLHVGHVQIGKHVGKQGQEAVAHGMPEIKNARRAAAGKTAPEHHIRLVGKKRRQELVVFFRVLLQVGVLDDDVARDLARAKLVRNAAPLPQFTGWCLTRMAGLPAAISSTILPVPSVEQSLTIMTSSTGRCAQTVRTRSLIVPQFVVYGNDHREARGHIRIIENSGGFSAFEGPF